MGIGEKALSTRQDNPALALDRLGSAAAVPSDNKTLRRIQTRSAAQEAAIFAEGRKAAHAGRVITALHAHRLECEETAVRHAVNVYERNDNPDVKSYIAQIADDILGDMHADMARVTKAGSEQIIGIVQRSAYPPPDTRSAWQRFWNGDPEEW